MLVFAKGMAFVFALGGFSAQALQNLSVVLAQNAQGGSDPTIAIISAGGSVSAVAGLVYIAKKFADGSLVAREPAQTEKKLEELVAGAVNNNAALIEIIKDQRQREDRMFDLLAGNNRPPGVPPPPARREP